MKERRSGATVARQPHRSATQTVHASAAAAQNSRVAPPDPAKLLAWYDRHRRVLPWRAPAGRRPDPYAVWLSEIMLQQTTVATVRGYYERFLTRWPTVEALAAAPIEAVMQAWAGLGYYSRARNLHACAAQVVAAHGGRFPADEAELRALPGIGAYTAAAIAAIAFDLPAIAVDGNVERVVSRLFAIAAPLPQARAEIRAAAARIWAQRRPGDFAQAMMDLGSMVCTPRRPICGLCPFAEGCLARGRGAAEDYPVKAAKAPRPVRRGVVFLVERADGCLLVGTREPKGLLGGMSEFPGTPWHGADDDACGEPPPPLAATYRELPGCVRHVFTHFALELTVRLGSVPHRTAPPPGRRWVPAEAIEQEAMPTVMLKVLAHAVAEKTGAPAAVRRRPP